MTQLPEELNHIKKACKNSSHHVAKVTKFGTVAPNICGPLVWNVFLINLVASRTFEVDPDFWKICAPKVKVEVKNESGVRAEF
jgi:hypothetical protein